MQWRNPIPWLKALWLRDAGPMNWKNPIRVFAVVGWQMFQTIALLVSMSWRGLRFFAALPPPLLFVFAGLWYAVWNFVEHPFPALDENPLLDLMDYHTPTFYGWVVLWYYTAPFVTVMLAGFVLMSIWKVWFESRRGRDFATFGGLPTWPLSTHQKAPGIVIGEVHHPVEAREIFNPSWLTIPERGLYTGVAIFGAVGSGKTSACMNPFARQLLGWQAANPQMRAAALVLEVKGDFCYDIRQILVEAGREKDYIELGMEGRWQWNPLSAWWLDSYSLAYTVSSLLNQLFGKGKEPFWQQAYTNLVRWIIELYRVFPERWVTLQEVYRCAIDPELFAAKIEEAEKLSDDLSKGTVFVSKDVITAQPMNLGEWVWTDADDPKEKQAAHTRPMKAKLDELGIDHRIVWESGPGEEMRERVEAVKRWFVHDWQALDNKVKSSIVEGVSVFLAMFDMPDVAKVFCPKAPEESDDPQAIEAQAQILRIKKAKKAAAATIRSSSGRSSMSALSNVVPGQLCYIAAMIVTTHLQFVKRTLAAVALLMAVAAPATPQAGDLRGNYNPKSGLITVSIESGIDIKVVTTDAVPGKKCEALETQFPVMVLPTSGALGGRTLADGAIRGMKSLRQAAVEAGANSVVGLRTAPYSTRNGNPRMFVYGTLANCE